jgi:Raf kinase inhibitor-like YbhB/YbcL family protein
MTLTTSAWPDGGQIPAKYTQAGDQVSPQLAWSNVPDNIASFVLIVHDVDAAIGNGTDDILHWMLWNIPATATSLPEGVPQATQLPDGTRQISVSGPHYRGPVRPRPVRRITMCSSSSRWIRCSTTSSQSRRTNARADARRRRRRDGDARARQGGTSVSSGVHSSLDASTGRRPLASAPAVSWLKCPPLDEGPEHHFLDRAIVGQFEVRVSRVGVGALHLVFK